MRYLLIVLISINLYAISHNSNIAYNYISYSDFENENLIEGDSKLKYESDNFSIDTTFEYLYSKEYSKKRYFDINELYLSKEYSNSTLYFGKQIKYWGELEGYNIADIFNKKRYLSNPFDKNKKIGSYTLNSIFYLEDSSIEFGAKFYEDDMKYPNSDEPYYPFSMNYSSELKTSDSRYSPSIYLKYSFPSEFIEGENKLVLWNGYDSKREVIFENQKLKQKAYKSTKLLYLLNSVYEDYIFKFEGVVTKVQSDEMSDYAQVALGVERSIYDIKGSDLGIYVEYYKYRYFSNSQKNIDISESYDDDIFLALKLNLNDVDASELKAGILIDKDSSERVSKIEFSKRLKDGLVLKGEYLKIEAKDESVLTKFDDTSRFIAKVIYSF